MVQSSTGYIPVPTSDEANDPNDRPERSMRGWALSPSHADTLKELDTLATLFDDRFRMPGTEFHFGLDSILGLVPGVGDTVTAGVSTYLVARARKLGVRKRVIAKMMGNVAIDWFLGLIPLVGDIFDFAHKANRKNIVLLRKELLMGR